MSVSLEGGRSSYSRSNGATIPKTKLHGSEKIIFWRSFHNSWRPTPAKLEDELHFKGGRSVTPHFSLCCVCVWFSKMWGNKNFLWMLACLIFKKCYLLCFVFLMIVLIFSSGWVQKYFNLSSIFANSSNTHTWEKWGVTDLPPLRWSSSSSFAGVGLQELWKLPQKMIFSLPCSFVFGMVAPLDLE